MSDSQIQCFLERLKAYHGAKRVVLTFEFEDGSSVRQEASDEH